MNALTVQSAFCRGGTSRGLIFHSHALARYDAKTRERIICRGRSPDLDGRQIDGVGGGTSSTSKTAIISSAGDPVDAALRRAGHALPGLSWIDEEEDGRRVRAISDVVYRFGQVSIKQPSIDWGSTCGNMVAAVALRSLELGLVGSKAFAHLSDAASQADQSQSVVVRILAHDTGKVVKARVPVQAAPSPTPNVWLPAEEGTASIAGVPGTAPGILIETPFGEGSILSTGNERDTIEVDGQSIDVTIVDTGLPVVIVAAESIGVSIDRLRQHPASIDGDRMLIDKLERIRHVASQLTPGLSRVFSPPSPKLCVVHAPAAYATTGATEVKADEMDLFIRVVSVGQLHRTVPATTLSGLAAAQCFAGSVVSQVVQLGKQARQGCAIIPPASQAAIDEIVMAAGGDADPTLVRAITVGQPAGLSTASVQCDAVSKAPDSVVMLRTARTVMETGVRLPHTNEYAPHHGLISTLS